MNSHVPIWRSRPVLLTALVCGFLFATAATAVVPSAASWTGSLVCGDGTHLTHATGHDSFGNTSQDEVSFRCVDNSGRGTDAPTLGIFGLQLLLGGIVGYALALGGTALGGRAGWATTSRARTSA
jgi:hypothetical protein